MTDKLNRLREQFEKKRVLEMADIMHFIGTSSRMTAYRYLKKLDYLSSYSHNGKFYTLRKLAMFDEAGIYRLGDIGFSFYGTLTDTIAHVVKHSESGKTSSELEHQYQICVKNALLDLVQRAQIRRERWKGRLFVYLSAEHDKGQRQLQKRRQGVVRRSLPDWLVFEVLVETIHASADVINAHIVASRLLKKGSSNVLHSYCKKSERRTLLAHGSNTK